MSDLWPSNFEVFIPWIALVTGFGGSLHCVGMCGGLVGATCHSSKDIASYQIGRLFSYLLLGAIGGTLGSALAFQNSHVLIKLAPSILIGGMFIFWGINSFVGSKKIHFAPKFLSRSYQSLWQKLVSKNESSFKPLLIGTLSILLPCGFLYAIVLGTMATQSPSMALIGMFFFWLGTLPAMLLAPAILQRILGPFRSKKPKIYAFCLIFIGLSTIGIRASSQLQKTNTDKEVSQEHTCH